MALGDEILVTIPQGTLRGRKETSTLGDIYYSFQGIPYGKPPVGELRFKVKLFLYNNYKDIVQIFKFLKLASTTC